MEVVPPAAAQAEAQLAEVGTAAVDEEGQPEELAEEAETAVERRAAALVGMLAGRMGRAGSRVRR